jgi:hypothetical protein
MVVTKEEAGTTNNSEGKAWTLGNGGTSEGDVRRDNCSLLGYL